MSKFIITDERKELLKKYGVGGAIAAVIYACYLMAQILGWIPSSDNKKVETEKSPTTQIVEDVKK